MDCMYDATETHQQAELIEFVKAKIAELRKTLEIYEHYLALLEQGTDVHAPSEGMAQPPPATPAAPTPAPAPAPTPPTKQCPAEPGNKTEEISLQSRKTGQELVVFRITPSTVEIIPKVPLRKTTPPLLTFLVDRIFMEMKRKDEKSWNDGTLDPDHVFDFELVEKNGLLERIILRGLNNPSTKESRMREIMSATRWTFERMLANDKADNHA